MRYNPRKFKSLYQHFKEDEDLAKSSNQKGLAPEKIVKLFNEHPELRFVDDLSYTDLAQMTITDPDDEDFQEMLAFVIDIKQKEAMASNDRFRGNYPPQGSTNYPPDFITLGQMPTNEPVGFARRQICRNILFIGPNGSGKTTALKIPLSDPELTQNSCVIVFGKKRELRGLIELSSTLGTVVVFRLGEFPLQFFQGPDVVTDPVWSNEISKTFGHCYERLSAHRLMNLKLCEMLANRPPDSYPTLRQLIEVLENLKPRFNSRELLYKESILFCLNDLSTALGDATEYSSSNFMNTLFSKPGLKIFEVETLAQEHLSFVANFFMKWIYCKKLYSS